jgi:hypothetical protein
LQRPFADSCRLAAAARPALVKPAYTMSIFPYFRLSM